MRNDIIYIRVFATILVVIGHCWFYDGFSGFHSDILPGYETNGILKWMNKIIYSFHMPVFFFISGLLLASKLRSNKQFKLCSFIANKAKRLLIPYIVITIFYCLPIKTLCGLFDNRDLFTSYLDQIFYATDSHMWFLLALFWCMLVGGCIIYIHYHKPKLYIPILIILFIVHIIGTPKNMNLLCISQSVKFGSFFLGGFVYDCTFWHNLTKKTPTIVFLILFVLCEILYLNNVFNTTTLLQAKINVVFSDFLGMLAILTLLKIAYQISKKYVPSQRVLYLDSKSFEIYLYSEPLNYIVLLICTTNETIFFHNSILLFVFRFVFTLLGALMISRMIKTNFGQKR